MTDEQMKARVTSLVKNVAHAIEPGIKQDIRACLRYRRLIRHGSEPRYQNKATILNLLGELRWCRKQIGEGR